MKSNKDAKTASPFLDSASPGPEGDEGDNVHADSMAQHAAVNNSTIPVSKPMRKRCASITPLPMREPIAPGIYTRIRKRSLTPLEVEMLGLSSPDVAAAQGCFDGRTPAGPDDVGAPLEDGAGPPLTVSGRAYSIKSMLGAFAGAVGPAGDVESSKKAAMDAYSLHGAPTIPDEHGNTGLPIIQEFILDSQFSITIEGRSRSDVKVFLYYVLCVLTFGVIHLVGYWFPKVRSIMTTTQSALATSSHIFVTNSYGQSGLVKVKRSYYGEKLPEVFKSQRVHEFLVLGEISAEERNLNDEMAAAANGLKLKETDTRSQRESLREEEAETGRELPAQDTILYSHSCQLEYQAMPINHTCVSDTSSFSSDLLYKTTGKEGPIPASEFLYFFEYRHIRFIYHPNTGRYFENSQWESFQSTSLEKLKLGLAEDLSSQRQIIFGPNVIKIQQKAIAQLLVEEVLHPFNIFQLYSFSLWMSMDYCYYAIAILMISALTICVNVYETQKNIKNIVKMAQHECQLNIYRNGQWMTANSDEVVPGDLIEFDDKMAQVMPCDALLLEGDCIVNESMLTGESTPVSKSPMDDDLWNVGGSSGGGAGTSDAPLLALTSEKSLLHAGTRLIRVRNSSNRPAKAVVINTGFNTTKGLLMRNIMFPRPINFKFYRDSMRFIGVLAMIAILGFTYTVYNYIKLGVDVSMMFIRALDLVTIIIPPALPLSMSIGTSFAMRRLKGKNIYCISPMKINISGKLNLFAFDKTGTLTEEGLDILGLHYVEDDNHLRKRKTEGETAGEEESRSATKTPGRVFSSLLESLEGVHADTLATLSALSAPWTEDAVGANPFGEEEAPSSCTTLDRPSLVSLGMASCHSVKCHENELVGDPLDVKMFEFTRWELEDSGYLNGSSVATIIRPPKERKVTFALDVGAASDAEEGRLSEAEHDKDLPDGQDVSVQEVELGILRIFDFSASLRRMSTLVKVHTGPGMVGFVKGAPESIRDICDPASLPVDFDTLLDHYTVQGYRVIALAYKPYPRLTWQQAQKLKREELECAAPADSPALGLTFLAFIVFENRLKSVSKDVITKLHKANFRTAIATGDNILTAISVARECRIIQQPHVELIFIPKLTPGGRGRAEELALEAHGEEAMPGPEAALNYTGEACISWESMVDPAGLRLHPSTLTLVHAQDHPLADRLAGAPVTLACTGAILEYLIDHCSPDVLHRTLIQCNIYARMRPDQKQRLMECLQRLEYVVGFCGDGANDCGAMKVSDVGLSLSEAEASIAAPFTCKVPDIRATLDLIQEGRSALATSFSCFKFMVAYSLIQFTTVTLLYNYTANLSDLEFTFIDLILVLPIAICIGTLSASRTLTIKRPPGKLVSKKILLPLLGQALIQIGFQVTLFFLIRSSPNYVEIEINTQRMVHECLLNSLLFHFTNFQYIASSFLFCSNMPYQMPLYTNKAFMGTTFLATVICLWFLLAPAQWVVDCLELVYIDWASKWYIVVLALLNASVSVMAHFYLFPACLWTLAKLKTVTGWGERRKRVKLHKALLASYQPSSDKV